jgi:hypothetical protein
MTSAFDTAPARKQGRKAAYDRAYHHSKKARAARAAKAIIKAPLAEDPTFAPSEDESVFWDELTSPLLVILEAEPMGLTWEGVGIACEIAGVKERFVTDAIAYLHNMARVHPRGVLAVRWFYGPAVDEV